MAQTQQTPPTPARVAVILHTQQFYDLASHAWDKSQPAADRMHVTPTDTTVLRLLPGLNIIAGHDAQKYARDLEALERVRILQRGVDPTQIDPFRAMALIEDTANPVALREWRAAESRSDIADAIDLKLAERAKRAN